MLYIVEMNLPDATLLNEWHQWYAEHLNKLLSVPGFRTAKRFQSMTPAASPYVAVYSIDSADVITSAPYRAKAGPESTGKWRTLMTNWNRNLLEGLDEAPDVPIDGWLATMDRRADSAPALLPGFRSLKPVGLDCSVVERGLVAGGPRDKPPTRREERDWHVRICRPLTPRMRPSS